MAPKRRAAAPKSRTVVKRPSKLAKEHGITANQEAEIREAFGLFAIHHPEYEDSKDGVLRKDDVRRCLISLNLTPDKSEIRSILSTIDPLDTGVVEFLPFLSYVAIALHSKDDDSNDSDDRDEGYRAENNAEEIRAAYKLFTHGTPGPITLGHLRRVAKELREDVADDLLRDMILEANGGVRGSKDIGGVSMEDFESVMKRAGLSFG